VVVVKLCWLWAKLQDRGVDVFAKVMAVFFSTYSGILPNFSVEVPILCDCWLYCIFILYIASVIPFWSFVSVFYVMTKLFVLCVVRMQIRTALMLLSMVM
jgi:hypothetical protein